MKRVFILATLATILSCTSLFAQSGVYDVSGNPIVVNEGDTLSIYRNGEQERVHIATNNMRIQHRLNRGLSEMDNAFVPKGQWIVGTTASYSVHENDNYTFTLIEGINSVGYTFKVSPLLAYAIDDNLAVGGRFEYGRSLLKIDSAMLSFALSGDDALEITVNNYYSLTSSYTGMAMMRQYIPLGGAKRFAFFAEIRLEGGYCQSKLAFDYPVEGTYSEGYNMGLSVVPGIVAFATNEVAFEVMVGVMGVGYSHTTQIHNQVYEGVVDTTSLSFKLNLFSVGLGVSFYL